MQYRIAEPNSYLMHYGVKGMKWGVRKGYVPKGRRRSVKSEGAVGDFADSHPELATQAVTLAAFLAVQGAKRVSDLHKQGWFNEKYTESDIKKVKTTKEHDLDVINPIPGVSDQVLSDLTHGKDFTQLSHEEQVAVSKAIKNGWLTNCVYCTSAAELRRRGYDVEAKNSPGRGHSAEQTMKWWKGSKYENFFGDSIDNSSKANRFTLQTDRKAKKSKLTSEQQFDHMTKVLSSQDVGAHGDFRVKSTFSGHSIEYSVEKTGVKLYDNQTKQKYNSINEFFEMHSEFQPNKSTFIRLDNCEPDINRMLKEHVIKPRGN